MSLHTIISATLLTLAVAIVLLSAIGLMVMRDALQRLHFLAPPAVLSTVLIAAACFIEERNWTAGAKAVVVGVLLMAINAVVTHATARAALVRAARDGQAQARVRVVGQEGRVVGEVDTLPRDGKPEEQPWT